jgi:hypothetical protein
MPLTQKRRTSTELNHPSAPDLHSTLVVGRFCKVPALLLPNLNLNFCSVRPWCWVTEASSSGAGRRCRGTNGGCRPWGRKTRARDIEECKGLLGRELLDRRPSMKCDDFAD